MLVNPRADGEAQLAPEQPDAAQQKYETMQCFAVSEPKSIKEEGEGELLFRWLFAQHLCHFSRTFFLSFDSTQLIFICLLHVVQIYL